MKLDKAYLCGTHQSSFRPNEPAEIISVVMFAPEGSLSTEDYYPCYFVRYSDGIEDYVAIKDIDNYMIVGFKRILEAYHQ